MAARLDHDDEESRIIRTGRMALHPSRSIARVQAITLVAIVFLCHMGMMGRSLSKVDRYRYDPQEALAGGVGTMQRNPNSHMSSPFYGWQAPISNNMTCSWRQCFQKNHGCAACREDPEDFGMAPETWIPDVTMLHSMMLEGKDANGSPWPPALDLELCEQIDSVGGEGDANKECEYLVDSRIHHSSKEKQSTILIVDASLLFQTSPSVRKGQHHRENITCLRKDTHSFLHGIHNGGEPCHKYSSHEGNMGTLL